MTARKKSFICTLFFLFGLFGCNRSATPRDETAKATHPSEQKSDPEDSFRICICDSGLGGFPGYTLKDLEASYKTCSECLVAISGNDIERYIVGRKPDGKVEIVLNAKFSNGLRKRSPQNRVANLVRQNPFSVSLNNRSLYIGFIYPLIGAAALNFPVMHIEEEKEQIRLLIGDRQGRWISSGNGPNDEVDIDPPELRRFFSDFNLKSFRF